jgi:hypothetical protein
VGAVVQFGKSVFDAASNVHDIALKLGVSTDAAQGFQFAAEQAGSSLDAVGTALNKMNANLAEGDKSTVKALKDAGLGFDAIRSMNPEDAFLAITDAIQKIPDPMIQSDVALKLFGKSAAELLPAIKEGFRGVAEGASKMSAETIRDLEAAQDAWSKVGREFTIVSGGIIAGLMRIPPAVKEVGSSLTLLGAFAADMALNGFAVAVSHLSQVAKETGKYKDVNLALPPALQKTTNEVKAATDATRKHATALQDVVLVSPEVKHALDLMELAHKHQAEALKFDEASWRAWEMTVSKALANVHKNSAPLHLVTRDLSSLTAQVDASYKGMQVHGELMAEYPAIVQKVTDSIGDLGRSFDLLASITSGAFSQLTRSLGDVAAAMKNVVKIQSEMSSSGSGSGGDGGGGGSKLGMIANIALLATGYGAVAVAAIAAGKAIANMFASKGRDLVVDFADTFGGFDKLHVELNALGEEGERLWIALTQGVGRNNPKEAQAAIDAITKALEKKKDASDEAVVMSEAEAQATIETAAEAARALDDVNERLKVNRDAWGEWSEDVTGYLQKLADDIRSMPLPTPGGASTTSGGGTSGGRYTGGASAPGARLADSVHVYIGNDAVDDHVLRVVRTKTPGDLMVRGR